MPAGRARRASLLAPALALSFVTAVALACEGGRSAPATEDAAAAAPPLAAAATATAASADAAATPPSAPAALPPATRTQPLGVIAALGDEGWLALVRAEGSAGGGVRLLLSFRIARPGWTSDAAPAAMERISLTDARGRRAALLEVTGSSAADDQTATALEGWYRFAPLPPGTRQVTLTYPVYEDGSRPVQVSFDLGDASPPLTPEALAGVWRTALVSGPSAATDARRPWPYERVEFAPDGRVLLSAGRDASARRGSFQSANGLRLSFALADGAGLDFAVDEFTPERLVLAGVGPAGTEWVVLTRP